MPVLKAATSNTKPERLLRRALSLGGYASLPNLANLPGTPDAVLPEERVCAFAHGCLWHAHGCRRSPTTKPGRYDWDAKLARTRRRDVTDVAQLRFLGYRVIWVWECALDGAAALPEDELVGRIRAFVGGGEAFAEIEGTESAARRRRAA